jgi:transketolase
MALGESIGLPMGKATRVAFGEALRDLGGRNPNIVVLDGDLNNSTRTDIFAKAHPDRFFNIGIAESNLAGMAGGLAASGKLPFVASFAVFMLCNAYDQLRLSVAYPCLNVKVVGSHGGISIGEDGPSQMAIEDIALACALPNFTVLVPSDETTTRLAVEAVAAHDGPTYMRTGRPNVPILYREAPDFRLGRAIQLRDGRDVTHVANGLMVAAALEAAAELERDGIQARVLDMHTAKPIDEEALARAARDTGRIVVAEEHLASGGLGSIVAQHLATVHPVPMRFVNLQGFAESGKPEELLEKYCLTSRHVAAKARELVRGAG